MPRFKYNSKRYKEWRSKIYRRDRFQCQLCGQKGKGLNAHHIKRKADHPKYVYDINNGITLCIQCHDIITGNEDYFIPLFNKIVMLSLTENYIVKFFSKIHSEEKVLLKELKKSGKWLKIPEALIKRLRVQDNIKKYRTQWKQKKQK